MRLPDVIDSARPSIVQVAYTVFGLSAEELLELGVNHVLSRPLGTGFLVNTDAYVVTAKHVIDGARKVGEKFEHADVHIGIGLAYPNTENMRGNFNITGFDVVEEDARHDLALLKMRQNPFAGDMKSGIIVDDSPIEFLYGVPTLRPERPRDGDSIAISGYPLGEPVLVTNAGVVASSWSVEVDEVPHPSIPDATLPEIRDVYLADVRSNPGNSGGPAYSTDDASVVGVLVAGRLTDVIVGGATAASAIGIPLASDAGLSLVVPVRYVIDMLDRNGVRYTRA